MYDLSRSGASGPRAGFWQRFAAYLIDAIIVVVAGSIVVGIFKAAGDVLFLVLAVAYYTYLEGGPTGQTLGKRAMQIRVVGLEDWAPIGFQRAFVRLAGHLVSALAFDIGYLWMLWDDERQTWHDKFARAVVVPEADYPVDPGRRR